MFRRTNIRISSGARRRKVWTHGGEAPTLPRVIWACPNPKVRVDNWVIDSDLRVGTCPNSRAAASAPRRRARKPLAAVCTTRLAGVSLAGLWDYSTYPVSHIGIGLLARVRAVFLLLASVGDRRELGQSAHKSENARRRGGSVGVVSIKLCPTFTQRLQLELP